MTAEIRQLGALLSRLEEHLPELARDVAADLAGDLDASDVEQVVRRLLAAVAGGTRIGAAELVRLRAEGAAAARAGRPLAAPIDAYLSSAWVAWEHAIALSEPGEPGVLATLGSALLRAGDDIAAALADGYTAAERALAMTAGAASQAVLDELLSPASGGPAGAARLARRATLAGLDPSLTYHVAALRSTAEILVEDDVTAEVGRRLARDPGRRSYLVAARDGDLVIVASGAWRGRVPFGELLVEALPVRGPWWAVVAGPVALGGLAGAYATALDGLRVAPAAGTADSVRTVDALALERALMADPLLAAMAVDRWLGPLEVSGRGGGELIATLEAWLGSGQSVVAAGRELGVAARTVSYRLARIARLLEVAQLGPEVRERLATALLMRRLLARASIR